MVVIIAFFVTSSDSGSLVIDMLASGSHPDPPVLQRVFWALLEGAVAAVLLLTGGLAALQTAAIATGLPSPSCSSACVTGCSKRSEGMAAASRDP